MPAGWGELRLRGVGGVAAAVEATAGLGQLTSLTIEAAGQGEVLSTAGAWAALRALHLHACEGLDAPTFLGAPMPNLGTLALTGGVPKTAGASAVWSGMRGLQTLKIHSQQGASVLSAGLGALGALRDMEVESLTCSAEALAGWDRLVRLRRLRLKLVEPVPEVGAAAASLSGLLALDLRNRCSRATRFLPLCQRWTRLESLHIHCSNMTELELSGPYLDHLQLLDLRGCMMLQSVPSGCEEVEKKGGIRAEHIGWLAGMMAQRW